MMRQVTHQQHQNDFQNGYEAKAAELREMGFAAARDKFNLDNPVGHHPSSLAAYYYQAGELAALVNAA
jgi:hypothetical protein